MKKHSFAICAYKESPYLERCILSLKNQTHPSDILMCTSTPNDYIKAMSDKYEIPLLVNPKSGDIQTDWNFAYHSCDSQYVTLVHQDDVYMREYSEHLFRATEKYQDILIFYSKYRSLTTGKESEAVQNDLNCRLRNLLSFPMRFPGLQDKKGWKQVTLRLGNSICCSSVTYNKKMLIDYDIFKSSLCYSLDWDIFWELTFLKGRFYYDKDVLTYFRIHKQSTSMSCIKNAIREKEDYFMFSKIWSEAFAKCIMPAYKLAYCNYKKLE